eukprot:Seg4386.4 transcript_id=Seg4386.4/GoldUCD/mRNA.D3Y31 product="Ubiquitin carboxyl-terminal hydrolase 17-like protein A" protein_id=Seg4386.4/GoldUCD/D3Y31
MYRLRNLEIDENTKLENPLRRWHSLTEEVRSQIKNHIFPAPFHTPRCIGPLRILSKRGINNPYNNCWSNSAFQIICGSVIFKFLPSKCSGLGDDMFKDIYKIHDDLSVALSTPVPFTKEMKRIVARFASTNQQEEQKQHDAVELMEMLISYLVEHSSEDVKADFYPFFTNVTVCQSCKKSECKVYNGNLHMSVRLKMEDLKITDASVQSLLWHWATNNEYFETLRCKCTQRLLSTGSYFLHLPTILFVLTDRVSHDAGQLINHNPIVINETLFLEDILAGKSTVPRATYRLAAVLLHQGRHSTSGHYNCVILSENGECIFFNDTNQYGMTVEKILKSKKCKQNSRLLVYINDMALQRQNELDNSPWHTHLNKVDAMQLEGIWFGRLSYVGGTTDELTTFRSLLGFQYLNGDIINGFLNWLANDTDQSINMLSSTFLPQAEGTVTNGTFMVSWALEFRTLYLHCNLILVPFHQESRGHWSVAGIYPQLKLIVHCDSIPDADAEERIFNVLADYIAKCRVLDKSDDDREEWTFIPLHKYGLQRTRHS